MLLDRILRTFLAKLILSRSKYSFTKVPVFYLTDDLISPPVSDAEEPVVWWIPDLQFVLSPEKLHVSESMKRILKRGEFTVFYDQDFEGVISQCKRIARKDREGAWITDEMKQAYIQLHTLGHAKSIEVRKEGKLVGGVY